jgi:hypothetical protein
LSADERIQRRIEKFSVMGFWDEVSQPKPEPVAEENNQ